MMNLDLLFDSLINDDLFDLFRSEDNTSNFTQSVNVNNNVVDNTNASSEELVFNFDENDPSYNALTTYITNNQFHDIIKDFGKDTFSLLHLNIRSLNKHFDDLQNILPLL